MLKRHSLTKALHVNKRLHLASEKKPHRFCSILSFPDKLDWRLAKRKTELAGMLYLGKAMFWQAVSESAEGTEHWNALTCARHSFLCTTANSFCLEYERDDIMEPKVLSRWKAVFCMTGNLKLYVTSDPAVPFSDTCPW